MKIRDSKIDLLRVIGLLLIILAHCDAPKGINDLRSFDVILLVYLSSFVAPFERIKSKDVYLSYCTKRILRLLKPTYIFIIVYSLMLYCCYRVIGRLDLFPPRQWINSFLMCEDSIGYVWIVKVYLVNSLLGPLFYKMISRFKTNIGFMLFVAIEFVLYIAIRVVYTNWIGESYVGWIIVEQWLMCCMAYLIVMQNSIWAKLNIKWEKYGYVIWLVVFAVTCVINEGTVVFSPSAGKRPVNLHYLSFGMAVAMLLIRYAPAIENIFIEYISKNSFALYLIHPVFILFFRVIKNKIDFEYLYIIEWFTVFALSVLTLWMIQKMHKCLSEKRFVSEKEKSKYQA